MQFFVPCFFTPQHCMANYLSSSGDIKELFVYALAFTRNAHTGTEQDAVNLSVGGGRKAWELLCSYLAHLRGRMEPMTLSHVLSTHWALILEALLGIILCWRHVAVTLCLVSQSSSINTNPPAAYPFGEETGERCTCSQVTPKDFTF